MRFFVVIMVALLACDHVVRVEGCPDAQHVTTDLAGADPPKPGEPCRDSTDPCLQCLATSCTCLAGPTTLFYCSGCQADGTCPSQADVCANGYSTPALEPSAGFCDQRGGWAGH